MNYICPTAISSLMTCFRKKVEEYYTEFSDEWNSRSSDAQVVNRFVQQAFESNENVCNLLSRREIDGRPHLLMRHFALKNLPTIELRIKQELAERFRHYLPQLIRHYNIDSDISDYLPELPIYYCINSDISEVEGEILQFTSTKRFLGPLISHMTHTSRFPPNLSYLMHIHTCIAPNVILDEYPFGVAFILFSLKDEGVNRTIAIPLTRQDSIDLRIANLTVGKTKCHYPNPDHIQ